MGINSSLLKRNKSILGLQNPVTSSDVKFLSSQCESTKLVRAVKSESGFSTADCLQVVKEEMRDIRKPWDDINDAKLEVIVLTSTS